MQPWQAITESEVEQIHETTLRILGEVGIVLSHPETRTVLLDAGAREYKDRIMIPPDLVEKCLSHCGGPVTVTGRNGRSVEIGGNALCWHNLGGARDIFDPRSGTARTATVQDVIDATRILDALEHATTVTPFYTPTDVPGEIMSLAMYRHAIPHTTKPVQGPGVQTPGEVQFAVEMAAAAGLDGVPSISVSPISPLTFPDELAASIQEIARHGIPFGPLPCPTAGSTAPMSLAGALTQQNAEVLASLVIAQLVRPGLPIIYCGRLAMMEPRTGGSIWGGVEMGLASAATVQIGHRYNLPVNVYGLSTNAHSLDVQDGYERALNSLLPALAGADELSGIGEMNAGVMGSHAQMVTDNDIAASVKRAVSGFTVDPDSLAFEVVASVMEGAHNYLAEMHTVRYLRGGELLRTKLGERRSFEAWQAGGREGMAERAQAEAERLLAEHQVEPLTEQQESALAALLSAAQAELTGQA